MDEQFGQLIEPAPVPFQFGAPGWYVLGILLLLLLAAIAFFISRYYRNNLYRRQALNWLHARETNTADARSPVMRVYEANMLLKRIAMLHYGRDAIAAVRGPQWIRLLNETLHKNLFDNNDELLLQETIYTTGNNIPPERAKGFIDKSITWIQQHHRKHAF